MVDQLPCQGKGFAPERASDGNTALNVLGCKECLELFAEAGRDGLQIH